MPVVAAMGGHVCVPDLTVVLTASAETLRRRVRGKDAAERAFDELTQDDGYWVRERAFYVWLQEAVAELGLPRFRVEIMDTDGLSPAEVADRVEGLVS